MIDERLLTVKEVAQRFGVQLATVRRWIADGRLHAVMPGGTKTGYRIPASEIDRLLSGEPQPVPPTSEPRARAVAELLHRAGMARAHGDDELANRFEAIAGGMAERDRVD